MTIDPSELKQTLDFAVGIAREAGAMTLQYFKGSFAAERKADNSFVTIADREAERFLRRQIEQTFPDDAILGEEEVSTDFGTCEQFGFGPAAEALQQRVHARRTWGDAYGHVLVATGRADIMLDPVMNVWDCAALLPIIEQAGGTFTDWGGARTIDGGNAISTNGRLFGDVMDVIRKEQETPSPLGRGLG